MTTRRQLVGQIQVPGQRPQSVDLVTSRRPEITSDERAAGIEAVDQRYEPGNVLRYFAQGDGATDDSGAFQRANDANDTIIVPANLNFLISSQVTLNTGTLIRGDSYDDGGSLITCGISGGAAFSIGTAGTAAPRVGAENVTFKGSDLSCDAFEAPENSLFSVWNRCNFVNLRYAFDASANKNWYFSSWHQCRFRDLWTGFYSPNTERTDEMSFVSCQFHNASIVYFRINLTGISGTYEVGETVTWSTSSETATVSGVGSDFLIVSKSDGTNGTPLTFAGLAGQTVTGGTSSATGTQSGAALGNRSINITNGDGLSVIGCNHNNQGMELTGCEDASIIGGYWESYNSDIPALDITGGSGHISIRKLPGTYFTMDSDAREEHTGRLPGDSRNNISAKVIGGNNNIFPNANCDTQAAVDTWAPSSMTRTLGGTGLQLNSTTTTNSRVWFPMEETISGACVAIRIKCTNGSIEARFENCDINSGVVIDSADSTDFQEIRLNTTYTSGGGVPYFALKTISLTSGNMDAEVDWLVVVPEHGSVADVGGALEPEVSARSINMVERTGAPTYPIEGAFYMADGSTWDPASKSGSVPYPVFYDGTSYNALY